MPLKRNFNITSTTYTKHKSRLDRFFGKWLGKIMSPKNKRFCYFLQTAPFRLYNSPELNLSFTLEKKFFQSTSNFF